MTPITNAENEKNTIPVTHFQQQTIYDDMTQTYVLHDWMRTDATIQVNLLLITNTLETNKTSIPSNFTAFQLRKGVSLSLVY